MMHITIEVVCILLYIPEVSPNMHTYVMYPATILGVGAREFMGK